MASRQSLSSAGASEPARTTPRSLASPSTARNRRSNLALARRKAEGLECIRFVEGNAGDLSRFADRSFDLVLSMDGAISFSGADAELALRESCRVTAGTVSHSRGRRPRVRALEPLDLEDG